MLFPDQELLNKLKKQADEYLELYKTNKHWGISKNELESWHKETAELGDRLITMEDNLIKYGELKEFKDSKISIYTNNYAANIKHNMETVLKLFYSLFLFMYKKLYNKSYPHKLPSII